MGKIGTVAMVMLMSWPTLRAQGQSVGGEVVGEQVPPQGLIVLAAAGEGRTQAELLRDGRAGMTQRSDPLGLLEMSAGLMTAAGMCVILAARLEKRREHAARGVEDAMAG